MAKKYQLVADGRVWCEGDVVTVWSERASLNGYFSKLEVKEV